MPIRRWDQKLQLLQKTGTKEEISTLLYNVENLNSLAEAESQDPAARTQARERKTLDKQGKEIRQCAMEVMQKPGSSGEGI